MYRELSRLQGGGYWSHSLEEEETDIFEDLKAVEEQRQSRNSEQPLTCDKEGSQPLNMEIPTSPPAAIADSRGYSLDSFGKSTEEDNEFTRKMHAQVERLTREQRDSLQETFRTVMEPNILKHGMTIMLRLFSDYPHYKNIWPTFKQVPDSSLMNAKELNQHAVIYMGGLRFIINSMDDDGLLSKALRKIAYTHVKRSIHKSHIMHMLHPLLEVVGENTKMSEEIRLAWTTLFDVIANLIDIFRVSETKAFYRK